MGIIYELSRNLPPDFQLLGKITAGDRLIFNPEKKLSIVTESSPLWAKYVRYIWTGANDTISEPEKALAETLTYIESLEKQAQELFVQIEEALSKMNDI